MTLPHRQGVLKTRGRHYAAQANVERILVDTKREVLYLRPFRSDPTTKRFRTFNHHVLDRLSLLQKLEFCSRPNYLPSQFCDRTSSTQQSLECRRSPFFPENRKVKPN